MAEKYTGIVAQNLIRASDMENALDTKVSLTENETIEGTKIFTTSPLVPSKATAAGNSPTVIATEAQVKAVADAAVTRLDGAATAIEARLLAVTSSTTTEIANAEITSAAYTDNAMAGKVSLTGDERISGTKTFTTSPLVPEKETPVTAENKTVLATEAQVYAANVWQ
ncbi:hypothetical protein NO1_0899 [Candidatus Termititenax aidoneus]|uniref:Uncharacterized protein n=1 Tax=Termititenax aidoneus TaxID=2218524 RepID=A0A388TA99_TERA1|nr:hypothetical protein NO1_0899 [Candidatus Termititenax aidoneus]